MNPEKKVSKFDLHISGLVRQIELVAQYLYGTDEILRLENK